jgi:hypothetical protein
VHHGVQCLHDWAFTWTVEQEMKTPVNGGEIGLILCQMFGIDPNHVLEIQVSARINELATVTIVTHPNFSDDWTMEQTYQVVRNEQ